MKNMGNLIPETSASESLFTCRCAARRGRWGGRGGDGAGSVVLPEKWICSDR